MGWFWHVLLGALVGIIARLTHPDRQNMGWIMSVVIGIVGSVLAALGGELTGWYRVPSWIGFFIGIALAVIFVAIYARIKINKE